MNINKSAKKIKRQILEYYTAVNLNMELDFVHTVGDLLVFQIKFKPGATEDKIRNYLKDVQQTVGLQLFQLHRVGMQLFFVASEHNIFDNRLLGVLTSPLYAEYLKLNNVQIPYVIGFDVMRKPVIVDLLLYHYWLLGGAGFTGKTVGMRSFITSLIWSCSPEQLNLIIIDDPAELAQFSALPHLSCPVIHDMNDGYKVIMKVYAEMKRRQKLKVENPEEYCRLPVLVCFIDECVSLVVGAGTKQKSGQLADVISQLLRKGRHAKIHTVLATQNPALAPV
jgi:S-DNA-T family DNA segregation ATPase FtsK/SpoIIIE